jgi:hypothetical protein
MPPPEEIEDDDTILEDEEMEEGDDLFEALSGLLTSEEGETVPTILSKLLAQFEMQNKILVKILTTLSKPAAS